MARSDRLVETQPRSIEVTSAIDQVSHASRLSFANLRQRCFSRKAALTSGGCPAVRSRPERARVDPALGLSLLVPSGRLPRDVSHPCLSSHAPVWRRIRRVQRATAAGAPRLRGCTRSTRRTARGSDLRGACHSGTHGAAQAICDRHPRTGGNRESQWPSSSTEALTVFATDDYQPDNRRVRYRRARARARAGRGDPRRRGRAGPAYLDPRGR